MKEGNGGAAFTFVGERTPHALTFRRGAPKVETTKTTVESQGVI